MALFLSGNDPVDLHDNELFCKLIKTKGLSHIII